MLKTLTVKIAPDSGVALIQVPHGELFSLTKDSEARVEHAPQMFNLHLDKSCCDMEIKDEYPFARVRHKLKAQIAKGQLIHALISTMDAQLSNELRYTYAKKAIIIVQDYPDTIEFARKIMLGRKLPEEAEIKEEILDKLSQPLQELFHEMITK